MIDLSNVSNEMKQKEANATSISQQFGYFYVTYSWYTNADNRKAHSQTKYKSNVTSTVSHVVSEC